MANEITLTASISVNKPTAQIQALARAVSGQLFTMAGNFVAYGQLTATVAGLAIPLVGVTAPHWAFFYNWDTTNFIRLANGSGGAKLIKLRPLEPAFVPLDDASTPYAFADTANCLMEYLICSL